MKKKLMMLAVTLVAMATPMLAQGQGGAASTDPTNYRLAAAYIALGIAAGLCGLGQGKATASAAEAIARNPGAVAGIRFVFILGVVLIESLTLYALMVTFIAK